MGGEQVIIHVPAGAALTSEQYRALNIGGTLAVDTAVSRGILQNKPKSGEDAAILIAGPSKFQAGAAVKAGNRLKVASGGWIVAANSGDTTIGISEYDVSSGAYSPGDGGHFDFRVAGYMRTSSG